MSCTPNPPGMTRVPRPGNRPPRWYDIKDGTQVVGQTERINESRDRYWRAWPAGGGAPRDFRTAAIRRCDDLAEGSRPGLTSPYHQRSVMAVAEPGQRARSPR